jgi:hypothetical protein
MKRAAVVIALSIIVPLAAHGQQADPEMLRLLLARANTLLAAGNVDGGLDALERFFGRAESIDRDAPESLRLLLQRALELRTQTRWANATRDGLDADFDRLIRLDPAYDFAATEPDDDLLTRFNRRRERLVAFLSVGISPADAEVFIDGRPLPEDRGDIIPVLAGDHVVSATRRGYAGAQEEVSVRANRTEGVGLTLERSSATIQIATTPPGASVSLDGEFAGTTQAIDESATSAPLVIEGLLPGWHEVEITLTDHRPFQQRFEVPALSDYDLGTLEMRLALGTLMLHGVNSPGEVWVDGASTTEFAVSGGSLRMQLPVGRHEILLSAAGGRIWTDQVDIADGGSITREVELRPGLAFLGVAGGDALDQDAAAEPVLRALRAARGWRVLDRRGLVEGLTAAAALGLTRASDEELRCRFEDEIPAALMLVAAIDETDPGLLHLSVWASGAPLTAGQITVPQGDPAALQTAVESLTTALPAPRPWHGLILLEGSVGPIVGAVADGSPAATAGMLPGDQILAADGEDIDAVGAFERRMIEAGPQASVLLSIARADRRQDIRVNLDTSPRIAHAPDAATAAAWWAQAASDIAAGGLERPVWALYLQQILLLIDGGELDSAADMLWDATAPADRPFGQAAVNYWLGVVLARRGNDDLGAARNALNQAASVPGARLYHDDGPLIGPRARARIAGVAARQDR